MLVVLEKKQAESGSNLYFMRSFYALCNKQRISTDKGLNSYRGRTSQKAGCECKTTLIVISASGEGEIRYVDVYRTVHLLA